MVRRQRMPIISKTSLGIRSERIMSIRRTKTGNTLVIEKIGSIQVRYITGSKVYGKCGWLKYTIPGLRFRNKSEEKKIEYEAGLLHITHTLLIKLLQNDNKKAGSKNCPPMCIYKLNVT